MSLKLRRKHTCREKTLHHSRMWNIQCSLSAGCIPLSGGEAGWWAGMNRFFWDQDWDSSPNLMSSPGVITKAGHVLCFALNPLICPDCQQTWHGKCADKREFMTGLSGLLCIFKSFQILLHLSIKPGASVWWIFVMESVVCEHGTLVKLSNAETPWGRLVRKRLWFPQSWFYAFIKYKYLLILYFFAN